MRWFVAQDDRRDFFIARHGHNLALLELPK
jgi:hypothetical protein